MASVLRLRTAAPTWSQAPASVDEQRQRDQRPDDPMRDDVDRRHRLQPFEVDRHDAPQPIGGEAVEKAGAGALAVAVSVGEGSVHPACA